MILPGLISVVFYRRRPSALQISLGLAFTIVLSGLLGYIQDIGTSRVWENVALAIVGGVILYVAVLVILVYWYFPKQTKSGDPPTTSPSAPPH
jgi:zinc transporter ZupT